MKRFLLLSWLLALAAPPAVAQEVVAIVSAKSPVTALNADQLAAIFLGKSSRFPDGTPAVPIDGPEDSPARERFYEKYTGKSPAQVKAHWSKIIFTGRGQPPRQAASSLEVRKAIADNPSAVGYLEPSAVDGSVRVLATR